MRRLLAFVLPLLVGCYTYVPIEPAAARPGMSVRARVSTVAASRVAPLLGTPGARLLIGRLIDTSAAGMIIEVPSLVPGDVSNSFETLHQRVSIARSELIEMEGRSLDRLRTGALVGGTAVVLGAALVKSLKSDPGTSHVTPGGPTEIRISIPLLRW